MSDAERQRWETIVEREMLGEPIDAEELAFRAQFERAHPECASESEAWSEMLGALGAEADAEGREHTHALASRVLVQRDVERDVVRPLRPAPRRSHALRNAIVATAAAAAVAAIVSTRIGDDEAPASASAENRPAKAPISPEVAPTPTPTPTPTEHLDPTMGRLALAGAGLRIDGGSAAAGASVHADQRIDFAAAQSDDGSSACVVQASPWITSCFSQGSALAFTRSEVGGAIELERGRVLVTLDALPPGQQFAVVTSKGSVAAVGTSFEVWIDDQGTVRASVLDGKVQVRDDSGTRPLAQGETTILGSSEVSRFRADALAWSRAHVDAAQLWHHADPGVLVVSPDEGRTRSGSVSIDALPVGQAPVSLLLPPGQHLVAEAGSARAMSIDIEEGATAALSLTPAAEEDRPAKQRPRPTVAQLVRKASEARGAHRYQDAARTLERLLREYPDGPDAQNARVELADLDLDKLGKPGPALRLYDAYLARGGPLTPEARHGRVRALERLGRSRDERAAIDEFLGAHPSDWRVPQLRARREQLGQP